MLRGTYSRQKEKTNDKVWRAAEKKARAENDHPTAEEFINTVTSAIQQSEINIFEDYVPVEVDRKRDEIYFSREKVPRIGRSNESVWFVTDSDKMLVNHRLSVILDGFDLNLGLVSSEDNDETTRYEIKIPFITEDEMENRIREQTVENAWDMRIYKDVDEDNIVGDCPNDGCDGERYRNGMGSCGPKYECTRFGCSFKFVKDVL